jgi:hypothetical protein
VLLNRCKNCGAPRVVKLFGRWNPDGTITAKAYNDVLRVAFVEYGEINGLIDGISTRIGFPIHGIVAEGERKANRSSTDELLSAGGGLLRLVGRSFLGAPFTIKITRDIAIGLGHGNPELVEHRRGKMIRLRMREPYSVPLAAGDLWGTYEAHYIMTAAARWEEEGDSVVITVEKQQDGMVWEDPTRLALKKMPTQPGTIEYERCPRCGVPVQMTAAVSWDTDRGLITNRVTGRREVLVIVETINAVIRELTWELGEDIPKMVCEIEQDYITGVLGGDLPKPSAWEYSALLAGMRLFGQGNPVDVTREAGLLTVRIDNPFCEPVLAGKVAGYYQALEGVRAEVSWTPSTTGYTILQVWPA